MSGRVPSAASLAPALALALLATAPRAWAQSAAAGQPTIGDLASRKVDVHRDTVVSANAARAMENYRHFLELQNTDPKLRAEALRRLGDLNLDAGEMQRLEQEVTAVDLQGAEAIKLYTTLLKAYPDYARNEYRTKIDEHRRRLSEKARAAGLDYFFLNTAKPLDEGLRNFLALRQRRM